MDYIIGKNLKRLRKERKVRQIEIAKQIGFSGHYVSRIEAGRRSISAENLYKLAQYLGVPMESFFRD